MDDFFFLTTSGFIREIDSHSARYASQKYNVGVKIRKIDTRKIKKVSIFDVFEVNNLPENMKSIAFKVVLQPIEKTFTDNEIEKISDNIIDLISKNFEGKLRQ